MSDKNQKSKISFFNANFTSIISVALVLLLLGLVALLGLGTNRLTQQIKENVGFDVIIKETANDQQINQLKQLWNRAPYISSVKYISKDDGLRMWEKETGENLIEIFGVNPLSAEFELRLKADYASMDSINKIVRGLEQNDAIESIQVPKDVVNSIDNNIRKVVIILSIIACLLMIISFALINNTVRLTVYSKRFIIHTMKLVGAKPGFIRRPFIVSNIINGIIAALISIAILSGCVYYAYQFDAEMHTIISIEIVLMVFGLILVLGVLLCSVAALFAANKYIRLNYDALFKR